MIKKVKQKELAKYLGVSVSAVAQYNKNKRTIMLIGLYYLKQDLFKDRKSNGKQSK